MREWRNGRRAALRSLCPSGRVGSSPILRTYKYTGRYVMARQGYTDGYGWVETTGPVEVVTSLSQLDWLVDVLSELPSEVSE